MENLEINGKNRNNNLFKKNKFKIRRKDSFSDENGENTSKIWKKKESLNKNSLTKNRTRSLSPKVNVQNKKRNSFFYTILNYNNIEEEIKRVIKEMRRACLWELRRQSYELKMLEINDKDFEDEKNNLPGKLSSKYLYNNSLNDKNMENYDNKNHQKFKTVIVKKNNFIKELYLNDKENEPKEENNNINELNNINPQLDNQKNNLNKNNKKNNKNTTGDKFRFLSRGGLVLDSNDENESDEEYEYLGYLINPLNNIIYIYDFLICF